MVAAPRARLANAVEVNDRRPRMRPAVPLVCNASPQRSPILVRGEPANYYRPDQYGTEPGAMSTTEQLAAILADHEQWLRSEERAGRRADLTGATLDGADLAGVDLSGATLRGASLNQATLRDAQLTHADLTDASLRGADLSGANLMLADFTGADLREANLSRSATGSERPLGAIRRGPKFTEADLEAADLSESFCEMSDFTGANLGGVRLVGTNLARANLSDNELSGVDLEGALLTEADLHGSRLVEASLKNAALRRANLGGSNLSGADVRGADLRGANLADAKVDGIAYDRAASYRGIRVATCYGSSRFRRYAEDQDYIEDIKAAHPVFYRFWLVFTDCGRSLPRVILWAGCLSLVFGVIYYCIGADQFLLAEAVLDWTFFNAMYYSVVTITTLGHCHVVPATHLASGFVMTESVLGYLMLGTLISVLATKVARRS
jgi:uncharacterized protein YjbI with pentapeptide repeats